MKKNTVIIIVFLVLGLHISAVPADLNVNQEISDITGYSVPRIDGLIDRSAPDFAINEWEDGLRENIILESANSQLEIELNSKYIADNIFLSLQSPTDLNDFVAQIDTDNDGSLSTGDARVIVTSNSNLGQKISDLQVYSQGEWLYLAEYNPDYSNFQGTIIIEEAISKIISISLGSTGDQTMVELSFSLSLYQEIFGVDVAQVGTTDIQEIGFGIGIRDINNNLYGYPTAPDSTFDLETYQSYRFEYLDFTEITTDISVDRIEVTQSVQTADNILPLVKEKDTLARVFVNKPSDYNGGVEVKLSGTVINLDPLYSGTWETLSQTFSPPATNDRSMLSSSANFELPDKWTKADWLILSAEVSPVGYIDSNFDDNKATQSINFRETHDLNIYYMKVNEATASSPVSISDFRPNFIADAFDHFEAMYPSANPNFIELGWEVLGAFEGTQRELKSELNKIALNIISSRIFLSSIGISESDLPPIPDFIFGFRTSGAGHSTPDWLGWSNSFAAWGGLGAAVDTLIMNHEINHNIGSDTWGRHTGADGPRDSDYGCGAGGPNSDWPDPGDDSIDALYEDDTLGWDPRYGLISWDRNDIMSYCQDRSDPKRWISDYRWEKWVDRLEGFVPGNPAPLSIHHTLNEYLMDLESNSFEISQGQTPTTRIISGFMDSSGGGYLEPSYTVEGVWPDSEPDIREILTPTHYVRVGYPNQLVEEYPLYGTFSNAVDYENTTETDLQSFQFAVSDNDTITYIELVDANGNVLDSYAPTSYGLQVELGVPAQITRGNVIQLPLTGSFGNQSSNVFTQLQYSNDGNIWHDIGSQTLGVSPNISVNKLPGGDQIQFRMQFTDGFQTEYVYGNQSSIVSDLSPDVRILQNQNTGSNINQLNQSLTKGSVLSLSAKAYDPEDGQFSDTQLSWEILDPNGNLVDTQEGKTISYQLRETGSYEVRVQVTDSNGQSSSDHIFVTVEQPSYLSQERFDEIENIVHPTSEDGSSSSSSDAPDPNILFASPLELMAINIVIIAILVRPIRSKIAKKS